MSVKTYKEMNQKIKDILRIGDSPECLYAAQRIEELEIRNRELEKEMMSVYGTLNMISNSVDRVVEVIEGRERAKQEG